MTRINCIPVTELTDKHLVAEYRELPRVFTLAVKAWHRGMNFETDCPVRYTLGVGHVKFFYSKLKWLMRRYESLVAEMLNRDFKPSDTLYESVQNQRLPMELYNDWVPTREAQQLNRQRIKERLGLNVQTDS